MEVEVSQLAEVCSSPVAAATYTAVPRSARRLDVRVSMKKEAMKEAAMKQLEIQKQKQALLQRQIHEQKVRSVR